MSINYGGLKSISKSCTLQEAFYVRTTIKHYLAPTGFFLSVYLVGKQTSKIFYVHYANTGIRIKASHP
jgi:hypothetical protein